MTYGSIRTTSFDAAPGLTATPGTFAGWAHEPSLVVTCVSTGPVVNPPSEPNPYDFTLPEP